jgi:hypothetical protein
MSEESANRNVTMGTLNQACRHLSELVKEHGLHRITLVAGQEGHVQLEVESSPGASLAGQSSTADDSRRLPAETLAILMEFA